MKRFSELKKVLVVFLLSIVVAGGTFPDRLAIKRESTPEVQVQYSTRSAGLDVGKAD